MAIGFELGSHYQMMDSNPAQNFGVVLLNSVHLQEPALSWSWARTKKNTEKMKITNSSMMLENIVFIWHLNMSNLEYKGYRNLLFTCLQNPARVQKNAFFSFENAKKYCSGWNWSYMFEILCIYYSFKNIMFFF